MDILKRAFHNISSGYSRGFVFKRDAFIKHMSYADQIDFDRMYDEYFAEAREASTPTADEKLKELYKSGEWSDAKEREIQNIQQVIDGMNEGKKHHLTMPSLVPIYLTNLKAEEKKLDDLFTEKRRKLGLTCESYAERQLNDQQIVGSLFRDKSLEIPLFTDDEFGYFDDRQVGQIISDYNKVLEPCTEQNVKKLAMQIFFQNYFVLAGENIAQFFGKPICHLTFYQINLLTYAQRFQNVYQNPDIANFPKTVMDDPDMLLEYAVAAQKGREKAQEQGAYDEGAIVIGGKKEDNKVLGLRANNDLARQVAESGGNLGDYLMKRG